MISIDYALTGMTSLRYFMPIVELGNNLNISSNFYIGRSKKYNCPLKHIEILESISKRYKIPFKPIEDLKFSSNPSLYVEADGISHKSIESKSYTVNFCTDYIVSYRNYIDKVDHLVFPSEYFSSKIDKNYLHKFLNIGSPKFDSKIDQNLVRKKYDLIVCTRCAYFCKQPNQFIIKCKQHLTETGNAFVDWGLGDHWRFENFKVGWIRDGEHEKAYFDNNFLYSCFWSKDLEEDSEVKKFWKAVKLNNFNYSNNNTLSEVIEEEVPVVVEYPTKLIKTLFLWPESPQLYIATLI